MTTYAEFRLRIERGPSRRTYRVEASGLGGEEEGRFKVPFSDTELENFILKVGRTRRGVRRIESPEMQLAKSFGGQLFGAVMDGRVRDLYRATFAQARAAGEGLRVTLSLTDVPELGAIPWEYLYDAPDFLSISTWTPVVRYLDLPRPRRPLEVLLPLRILGIVSAPSDQQLLDTDVERAKLEAALQPLVDAGAVSIDWLETANLLALARAVRSDTYHVIHYIGHGGFDDASGEGALQFEDEAGRSRPVSGDQLATILGGKVMLRLIVLNSCEGARTSVTDPFSGVAASLVQREIPAVIGMQFEITDRAAILFAAEFYSMLAEGQPVDAAVTEARLSIFADHNDVEWATPVLFMRVADGRLFDIADAKALPRRPADELATPVEPEAVTVDGPDRQDTVVQPEHHDVGTPTADPNSANGVPDHLVLHPSDTGTVTQLHYEATMPAGAQRIPRVIWLAVALGALIVLTFGFSLFANAPPGPTPGPSTTGSLDVNVDGARETGQVLVTGVDFQPGETVEILLDDVLTDSAVVGPDGSFSKAIRIGSQTSGTVSVEGLTSGNQASTDFRVRTGPASASPSG
jgi:hypothetical protein